MTKSKPVTIFLACLAVLSVSAFCAPERAALQTCTFSVSPAGVTASVNGLPDPTDPRGASSQPPKVTVSASKADCSWNASADSPWIQLLSSGGTGNGYIQYKVIQNTTGIPRTGTIQIAGKTFTIRQDSDTICKVVSVSPSSISVREQGAPEVPSDDPRGAASAPSPRLTVTTSKDNCRWMVLRNASWINVLTPRGTGSGYIEYRVLKNTSGKPRTGTIDVEGKVVTVNQEYTGTCSVSVSPASVSVPWQGSDSSDPRGAARPSILTLSSSKASCHWTATTGVDWIYLITTNGSGSGSVKYTVKVNKTGKPRTATIQVAGHAVTVNQDAEKAKVATSATGTGKKNCKAAVSPARVTMESKEASGTFRVTMDDDCPWTAKTKDAWISVTSGVPGKGSGTVQYTVEKNKGAKRKGVILVAGKTFGISQKEARKSKNMKTLEGKTKKPLVKNSR